MDSSEDVNKNYRQTVMYLALGFVGLVLLGNIKNIAKLKGKPKRAQAYKYQTKDFKRFSALKRQQRTGQVKDWISGERYPLLHQR